MERGNNMINDLNKCLICHDGPCSKACPHGFDVSNLLRSLKFHNIDGARKRTDGSCLSCSAPCQSACVLKEPVPIRRIFCECLSTKVQTQFQNVDLKMDFCGFTLENPFLLGSSISSSSYEMCKRAFQMGWAGASFKTITYIDVREASPRFSALKADDGTFIAFKNIEQLSVRTVEENLSDFRRLKAEFPSKFLLVSIMGRDDEEWRKLAIESEKAGADALELNFSCPNMMEAKTGSDIGQIPEFVERFTRDVKEVVHIPVIAKLTPNVMAMSPAAEAAKRAGADGIAAINTIKSLADIDAIHALSHDMKEGYFAIGGLSGQSVRPIAMRFIAELAQNDNLKGMHISAMGGIYNCDDALAFLSLGASSLQVTTAVMEYGYRIIDDLIEGLSMALGKHGYHSIAEFKGSLLGHVKDIEKIDRDHIIFPKFVRNRCVGCGRCYLSCRDGGHQALSFVDRKPMLDPSKCEGCHLCVLVCPNGAIVSSERPIKRKNAANH